MFKKNFYLSFYFLLISSSLISISANSWFLAWLGFEINVMSFIPLMLFQVNFNFTEMAIKYFTVQAFASLLLIAFSVKEIQSTLILSLSFQSSLIFISLGLKMGIAPLHFWFPQITKKMKWKLIFILITWQKIAPLFLISSLSKIYILPFLALTSAIIGAWGGSNQNNFKLIMTFSSIAHSGWLILLCPTSAKLTFLYFIIYTFTVVFIIWVVNFFKKNSLKNMNISSLNLLNKMLLTFNILSLGGLPPFLGFTAKILTILLLLNFYPLPVILILILTSLITLIFYLKIIFPFVPLKTLTSSTIILNFKKTKNMNFLFLFILIFNFSFSLLILLT